MAVATTGGNLRARFVIHTVGPIYEPGIDQSGLLRSCYTTSLGVADDLELSSVAFPLISSGAFGWPLEDAIRQAVTAIREAQTAVTDVRLVLFGAATYDAAKAVLGKLVRQAHPYAAVRLALALHLEHRDPADLAGRRDVGAAVGLHVEADDVDDADLLLVGRDEVGLGPDDVGQRQGVVARQHPHVDRPVGRDLGVDELLQPYLEVDGTSGG
jgi:hypothetical protein